MGLIQKQYDALRKKLLKSALEHQRYAFKETRNRQKQNLPLMGDLKKIREQVKRIRSESVGNWELLDKAIAHLEKNQFRVIQAREGEEACVVIREEIGDERLVVKSKSNVSKEIGLSGYLKNKGLK